MNLSNSYSRDLGTDTIGIVVGRPGLDEKRYVVHKQLLTSQSEFFRNAFSGGFREGVENNIHLEDDDPTAIALFISWIYRGAIPGTGQNISPFRPSQIPRSTTTPSTPPSAELIASSSYPYYPTTRMEDDTAEMIQYQNLCCQARHAMFSQEELRVAEYIRGRRYPDDGSRPTSFAHARGLGWADVAASRSQNQAGLGNSHAGTTGLFPGQQPNQLSTAALSPSTSALSTTRPSDPFQVVHPASTGTIPGTSLTNSLAAVATMVASSSATNGSAVFSAPVRGAVFSSTANAPTPTVPSITPQSGGLFRPSSGSRSLVLFGANPASQQRPTSQSLLGQVFDPSSIPHQRQSLFGPFVGAVQDQNLFGGIGHSGSHYIHTAISASQPQSSNMFGTVRPAPTLSTSGLFGPRTVVDPSTPYRDIFSELAQGYLFPRDPSNPTANDLTSQFGKRPGDFGYSALIEHPESPGIFLPGIPRSKPLGKQSHELSAHQDALLHLCLFAEKILWPTLFNTAVEAYVRGEFNLHRPIPAAHIELIYERTHSESTLRAYVLESMCTNVGDSLMYIELTRQYDDLMEDILHKLPTLRASNSGIASREELVRSYCMKEQHTSQGETKDVEISGVPKEEADGEIN